MPTSLAQPLEHLLQSGQVWRGQTHSLPDNELASTGYAQLDELLGGGLAYGHLHEVQLPLPFVGELQLVRHALQNAAVQSKPVFWINPPAQPQASCLSRACGSDAQHVVLENLAEPDAVWAMRTVLQANCAAVCLLWLAQPGAHDVRILQKALQGQQGLGVIFCTPMTAEARSYHTRLRAVVEQSQLRWQIIKRPQGWPTETRPQRMRCWN
ncbi:ImuA family protein [Aliidiomarina sp. Khilg15.8]